MTVSDRFVALLVLLGTTASGVGCVSSVSTEPVLRVEYTSGPDAQGDVESGVVFWRPTDIVPEELPTDLQEKLGSTFPIVFQLDDKLANTCFVTNDSFGLTSLDRRKSELGGPLWLTVDAGWTVDFFLLPDGTIRGTTGHYFSSGKSGDPDTLKGTYREVADFTECYEKVRSAPSDPAT
jgi:hypothetical protein